MGILEYNHPYVGLIQEFKIFYPSIALLCSLLGPFMGFLWRFLCSPVIVMASIDTHVTVPFHTINHREKLNIYIVSTEKRQWYFSHLSVSMLIHNISISAWTCWSMVRRIKTYSPSFLPWNWSYIPHSTWTQNWKLLASQRRTCMWYNQDGKGCWHPPNYPTWSKLEDLWARQWWQLRD